MQQPTAPQKIWHHLKQWTRQSRRMVFTAVGVAGCVIGLRTAGFLQAWELAALDQFFLLRPLEPVDQRIVIVGIEETDLRQVGKWPIPDALLAQLLQKIQTYQPRVIGLDLYRDLPVEPGYTQLLQIYRQSPNLIGILQIRDKTSPGVPAPSILDDRKQVGFNNLVFDPDGKARRGMLYWTTEDATTRRDITYTSFSLALALRYLDRAGVKPKELSSDPSLQLGKAIFRPFSDNDGGYVRADDGAYQILANLRGPSRRMTMVSMTDVMQGRIDPNLLRDRIVLIGSTAISLKDVLYTSYSTPILGQSQTMSGVEFQANMVSQILSSALEGRPLIQIWDDPLEWLWILFWSGSGVWICWRLRSPLNSALVVGLTGIGLSGFTYLAFLSGWWLPLIPPLLGLSGAAIVMIGHIAYLQEELRRSKEFLSSIINTIADPIFVKDRHYHWVVLNQAFCQFLGCAPEDLLDKVDTEMLSADMAALLRQEDDRVFQDGQERETEAVLPNRYGKIRQIATKRSLHKDAAGNVFLVGIMRDITERKQMEEELQRKAAELMRSNAELIHSTDLLRHQALHDTLTGLPNRKLFEERLEQAIHSSALVALLFLDLDGFKLINDTLGHDIGDQLLQAVARRLTNCLRGSDTVARLGGDEFTVILPAIPNSQIAARVAEKILSTLAQPFILDNQTIEVTVSIGIGLYPSAIDADDLVKQADMAMYQAKESGKNRYIFFAGDGAAIQT